MTNSADPDQLASLQKPTDLDLHCLLRQGMMCSAREGLTVLFSSYQVEKDCSFQQGCSCGHFLRCYGINYAYIFIF